MEQKAVNQRTSMRQRRWIRSRKAQNSVALKQNNSSITGVGEDDARGHVEAKFHVQ